LVLACGSKPAVSLNVIHAAASFADTFTTQRGFDVCRVYAGCIPRRLEANPLTRPFQSNGRAIAYTSTAMGVQGLSYLAQRMRTSNNRVLKRIWWLPQAALSGTSGYLAYRNTTRSNAALRMCGMGCVNALR